MTFHRKDELPRIDGSTNPLWPRRCCNWTRWENLLPLFQSLIDFFSAFLRLRFAPLQAIFRARLRRLRASLLGHHQKLVNGLGGASQNLLIFGYFRAIRNTEEGLTSAGKEMPEREMSVAQAVGQVGP